MSNSISSYLPLYTSNINALPDISSLLASVGTQSSTNPFGDAVSFNLSDSALSLFGGVTSSDSSSNDIMSVLTYSNYASNGLASSSNSAFEDMMNSGGPLPAFLKQVEGQLHLDDAHKQALEHIAMENINATKTSETIDLISRELAVAGI